MARSTADLQAINTEITTNPLGFPDYKPLTPENDADNAAAMNLVRDGTVPGPVVQVQRWTITGPEIQGVINEPEYVALSEAERQYISMITAGGTTLDTRPGSEARQGILSLFPAGSTTRENFLAIANEYANRVEEMFREDGTLEFGGSVTEADVAQARLV